MTALRPTTARNRPRNMERVQIPRAQREFIETQALGIFTDMVNGGCTMQQALAAVYLSGMGVGVHTMREVQR